MRKLSGLLAGTALAAALAAGAVMTPAASAATTTATSAASTKHFFGNFYSGYDKGHGEDFGHRSYFKGYWTKSGGYYKFYGDLFDRDRDREYSYVWYRWQDKFGSFHVKYFGKTRGHGDFDNFFKFKKGNVRDFDIRVCEGSDRFDDCGRWGDAF